MNLTIDLVYFAGCPHVQAAREALHKALALEGRAPAWREWTTDDPALPAYAAGFGSPSIFVAGRELTGAIPGDSAPTCRVYFGPDGERRSAPEPSQIAAILREQP